VDILDKGDSNRIFVAGYIPHDRRDLLEPELLTGKVSTLSRN
jgi:hypothetical protein